MDYLLPSKKVVNCPKIDENHGLQPSEKVANYPKIDENHGLQPSEKVENCPKRDENHISNYILYQGSPPKTVPLSSREND